MSRSEDVTVLISKEKTFLDRLIWRRIKKVQGNIEHLDLEIRLHDTVKKGETMQEIRWEDVQGSRRNCRLDETKVMYEVCFAKVS